MPKPPKTDDEQRTRTMNYWLGRRAREIREQANQSRNLLAGHIPGAKKGEPIDPSTLSRFENGHTFTPYPDVTVATYALLCEYDARKLWVEAATNFLQKGGMPLAGRDPEDATPAEKALLAAREADLRTRSYDGESQDTPTSNRRRRAGS